MVPGTVEPLAHYSGSWIFILVELDYFLERSITILIDLLSYFYISLVKHALSELPSSWLDKFDGINLAQSIVFNHVRFSVTITVDLCTDHVTTLTVDRKCYRKSIKIIVKLRTTKDTAVVLIDRILLTLCVAIIKCDCQ